MRNPTRPAYDRLITALEDHGCTVRANGHSAMAQCPAHDDQSPSLHITASRDCALVYCHSGCETDAVLETLGLTKADLFDTESGVNYKYSDGRLVRRRPNKTFSQTGKKHGTALYCQEHIGDAGTVYVVEGEKDVDSIRSIGGVAVCSAMGAGKAHLANWKPLHGKNAVIIADDDEAGYTHAQQVSEILAGHASVVIMKAAVGNDVSDHIAAGKKLDELKPLPSLLDSLSFSSEWLEQQTFPDLETIVPGLLVEGVTVLAGPPKVGKSFLVTNIALAVASGGKALGCLDVEQRPVLVLALEDGQRRLQSRYRDINGGPLPPGITFITKATPAECLLVIAEYLERYGHLKPLIILDTLGKVKPQKQSGQESYLVDYELGGKFKALVDAYPGSGMLVIHHTRKADAADFVDLVSGTQGIAGSVDSIVTLARKRGETDAVLSVTGRDVVEGEYALTVDQRMAWRLDGQGLDEAAQRLIDRHDQAEQERRVARLGPEMKKVLALINERGTVTAEQIAFKFDLKPNRVGQITTRLVEGDFIVRGDRGEFQSLAYAANHSSTCGGASGATGESGVSGESVAPLTPDTPLSPDRDIDSPRNTCPCGAPLMQTASIERGLCAQCWPTRGSDK
ncbi:AAA family ATPase [Mycobacterium colombiense]